MLHFFSFILVYYQRQWHGKIRHESWKKKTCLFVWVLIRTITCKISKRAQNLKKDITIAQLSYPIKENFGKTTMVIFRFTSSEKGEREKSREKEDIDNFISIAQFFWRLALQVICSYSSAFYFTETSLFFNEQEQNRI